MTGKYNNACMPTIMYNTCFILFCINNVYHFNRTYKEGVELRELTPTGSENNSLYSIQILRGLAALAVVAFHGRWFINGAYSEKMLGNILFDYGSFGVDMFFIISGFIITMATERRESAFEFTVKRFFRIYPLYLVCLILFVALSGASFSIKEYIHAITLTPMNYTSLAPYYGYNILAVAWTLSYEILFYAIFCLSMIISRKHGEIISTIGIFMLVFIGWGLNGGITLNPIYSPIWLSPINYATNPIILNFVLGMLSYNIYSRIRVVSPNYLTILYASSMIIISLCFLGIVSRGMHHGVLMWGGLSFFIVTFMSIMERAGFDFNHKKLVFLGGISYSLYLVHPVVFQLFRLEYMKFFNSTGFVKFLSMIFISIGVSMITNMLIEKPSQSFARNIIKRYSR
ncbi:acyltransferase family protein [Escherichia coli]|uniref:acyltransferase family protein n=1 Tax=Escherichia coli TaxID=562 RepID=UPI0032B3AE71